MCGIASALTRNHAVPAQMQKLVERPDFAQVAVSGRMGRITLRPLYNLTMRGGRLNRRVKWALSWRFQMVRAAAPRLIRLIRGIADARISQNSVATTRH